MHLCSDKTDEVQVRGMYTFRQLSVVIGIVVWFWISKGHTQILDALLSRVDKREEEH